MLTPNLKRYRGETTSELPWLPDQDRETMGALKLELEWLPWQLQVLQSDSIHWGLGRQYRPSPAQTRNCLGHRKTGVLTDPCPVHNI